MSLPQVSLVNKEAARSRFLCDLFKQSGLSLVVKTAHSFLALSFPQPSIGEMRIITKQLQICYYFEVHLFHESQ